MINVAINGFGRIGRNFLRLVLQDPQALKKLKIVAINIGPAHVSMLAHMFKYDTIMGMYKGTVELDGCTLFVDEYPIKILPIGYRNGEFISQPKWTQIIHACSL